MPRLGTFWLAVVLVALIVAAYLPVWHNEFLNLDDEGYIFTNPQVMHGLSWSNFVWVWTTDHCGYYQPISWLSLQVDAQLFSGTSPTGDPILSPAAFHAQGLFWHTASAVLLFVLWQRLTGMRWSSFLVAALFALHPLRVESVAWAAERKDVLSVFFGLATLWAYLRYTERPGVLRYLAVMIAMLLSLLSKPMLLTLPFVLLLLDYWPLGRTAAVSRRRLLLEKVPLLGLTIGISILTWLTRQHADAIVPLTSLSFSARLANALTAYAWYVGHTFYPVNLAVLYPHPYGNWSLSAALVGLATLLVLSGLALWQRRRRPWLIVGWLWFVGTLLPVIGFAQGGTQAWADRFTYWPHIGLITALVWGLREVVARIRVPAAVCGMIAAGVLIVLVGMTQRQVTYWRDSETLWVRALALKGQNHVARMYLIKYYLDRGELERVEDQYAEAVDACPDCDAYWCSLGTVRLMAGKVDEAVPPLLAAVKCDPTCAESWHYLGAARFRQGDDKSAIASFRKCLALNPEANDVRALLGQALWHNGECEEALRTFADVLGRDPQQFEAWQGLGTAYLAQGRTPDAIDALSHAVQVYPASASGWSDLGVALGRDGRWADAVAAHQQAVRYQEQDDNQLAQWHGRAAAPDGIPQAFRVRCRLAFALRALGNDRAADELYRSALNRDPRWPWKFAERARHLATDPNPWGRDPQTAWEMASQTIQAFDEPPAALLDAQATTEAARGQFTAAVATEERALHQTSRTAADGSLAEGIRQRVHLFKQGRLATGGD